MTTQEVANRLVELCRTGQYEQAQKELYHEDVISVEPPGTNYPEITNGLDGVLKKGEQWASMVEEVHGGEISDPIVAGTHFSVSMINDVTFKEMGRMKMEEVAVYEVKEGKVTKEQFFFDTTPPSE